jgi:prepilin-type N-terminal cleavage/methylation domain-containing protein
MKKGFTLIELMIVVVIIGILAAIAIPKFSSVKDQAEQVACQSNMRSLGSAEAMYYGRFNAYGSVADLAASFVMENATDMECPTSDAAYTETGGALETTYLIGCAEAPNGLTHGSIEDGIVSWQ